MYKGFCALVLTLSQAAMTSSVDVGKGGLFCDSKIQLRLPDTVGSPSCCRETEVSKNASTKDTVFAPYRQSTKDVGRIRLLHVALSSDCASSPDWPAQIGRRRGDDGSISGDKQLGLGLGDAIAPVPLGRGCNGKWSKRSQGDDGELHFRCSERCVRTKGQGTSVKVNE